MTKGQDFLQTGMDAAALASFERAILCKSDPKAIRLAAMSACRSKNVAKARRWLSQVPAAEAMGITQICVRNGIVIDLSGASCDADALRQKGEDALQTGMDAVALRSFEASMACRPDGALERFAFMAACRSKNAESARRHYARLSPATTTGIVQICERNGIFDLGGPQSGTLKLQSKPAARIFIDGVDSGKTTPASMMLPAGKHKVTFLVGAEKFTYQVAIEPDKTVSLTKDLQ
ncbi:MAG: PEGA domain-containing protein [Myxococcales bacterium]|nr:PEGA domain-containing protein [Myxococcales bacterium]